MVMLIKNLIKEYNLKVWALISQLIDLRSISSFLTSGLLRWFLKCWVFLFFLLWAIEIPQITFWSFSFHERQEILEAAAWNIHISFVFNLRQMCGVLAGDWHRQPWSFSRGCWAVICSSPTDRTKQGASFGSEQDPGLTKG